MAHKGPKVAAKPDSTLNKTNEEKRRLELIQLETRYKSSYRLIEDNDKQAVVRLAIKPSDPDFPYELDALRLQLNIPQAYPQAPCTVQVLNSDIPKGFAFNLEKGYAAHVDPSRSVAHQTLVRQMNWLDRNMESLLQQPPAATVRFVSNHKQAEDTAADTAPQQEQEYTPTTAPITASSSRKQPKSVTVVQAEPDYESSLNPSFVPKNVVEEHKQQPQAQQNQKQKQKQRQHQFSPSSLTAASERRKKELSTLQTRFCDSFRLLNKESTVSLIIAINDTEFTNEQLIGGKDLAIRYHIPALYPLEPCTLEVDNKQLDRTRSSWVVSGFNDHVKHGDYTLFENLNWLNRNLESLLTTPPAQKTEEQLETEELAKAQQKDFTPPVKSTTSQLSATASEFRPAKKSLFDEQDSIRKNKLVIVNDPSLVDDLVNEQAAEEEIEVQVAEESTGHAAVLDETKESTIIDLAQPVVRKGTEIRLINPTLENISLFRCTSLHLIVKCARCKNTMDIENIRPETQNQSETSSSHHEKTERWTTCSTCTSILGVKFLGELIHQGAQSIGLLQLAGCTAFDILPSTFTGTCGSCMADMPSTVRLAPHDSPRSFNCFSCHVKMTSGLGDYRFVKRGDEGGDRLRASDEQVLKLKKKKTREPGLTIGEPLPDQGTCSHYRKSKRWFRFSCCSKLYPCDHCHDSQEDHPMEMAKRMVCGLCSREQTIQSGRPCVCGNEFEKAPLKGAFWEGGKGVRDKKTMSRKDLHKHKGIGKTASKKQERVGAAGKERRHENRSTAE
ncbi:Uncharacterized protein C18H10.09 [Choanephora cucurbitarum]|uniref:Uncharacterized protein C18H10.09 n=1 Tax=Choanephora cucurbitarum TaxID=101091 RepID=A0A1C7NCB0_9FUNG|nr:Uncharacterized protein C18H10.09 [Choanephora cucurbitarum]